MPDWEFGEVVRHTQRHDCRALVLGWDSRVEYNPTESIVVLMSLAVPNIPVGEIFKPYCGWWEPAE